MLNPGRPTTAEHLPYFSRYIDLVPDGSIVTQLEAQLQAEFAVLEALTPEQAKHRYAPDKWSVLEVIGHICDTERVFSYRALHVARNDPSPLPGFDQDVWMQNVDWTGRTLHDVMLEWRGVRSATLGLFSHLDEQAWTRHGTVSGNALSPRACAYIIAGHVRHHMNIFKEHYGVL